MPNYQRKVTPEEEAAGKALDELYPRAKSRTIADYEGKKYQLKYFPIEKTDDGTEVKRWGHRWVRVREN